MINILNSYYEYPAGAGFALFFGGVAITALLCVLVTIFTNNDMHDAPTKSKRVGAWISLALTSLALVTVVLGEYQVAAHGQKLYHEVTLDYPLEITAISTQYRIVDIRGDIITIEAPEESYLK